MVDHADYYLAISRSDAYMRRHMDVQGQWPTPGQSSSAVELSLGAAWALRHAGGPGTARACWWRWMAHRLQGRKVLHRYAIARTAQVGVALRHAPLVITGSLRPVVPGYAARTGAGVGGCTRRPGRAGSSLPITVCGMAARVPKGADAPWPSICRCL